MYALVDCNNFFASCEQVFDPTLRKKPLLILSRNDGCVIARSREAKALGIAMGAPFFTCRDAILRHKIAVRSSNFALYADMSQRVMQTLLTFSLAMEIYSVDEAFLHDKIISCDLGSQIRAQVIRWTGIPVSVGIGKTKTLAKLAIEQAKKGCGVFALDESNTEAVLKSTPIDAIWGIGGKSALKLRSASIYSAYDLICQDNGRIQKLLSVAGLKTALELRGQDCFTIDEHSTDKTKSILCSRSFSNELATPDALKEALAYFCEEASVKLRRQKQKCSLVQIFISSNRFKENFYFNTATEALPVSTAYTPEITERAHKALKSIYQPGYTYKRCGVLLSGFSEADICQRDLFASDSDGQKKEQAMQALDEINRKSGKRALFFAVAGTEVSNRAANLWRSPNYTTCWEDLIRAGSGWKVKDKSRS